MPVSRHVAPAGVERNCKNLRDARRFHDKVQPYHGLWLSLVERLNGVQEVPGSNPGSPIFRDLGKLLRSEEVREDCEVRDGLTP